MTDPDLQSHTTPEMAPDTEVWISTPRNGINYHDIAAGYRKTVCGRYIGRGVGYVERGYVQSLAEVVGRYGSRPCKTCGGSSVPPSVVPSRDRTWTS